MTELIKDGSGMLVSANYEVTIAPGSMSSIGEQTFLCMVAHWREGALELTTARTDYGNPSEPADRIILPVCWPAYAVVRWIGPKDDDK